MKQHELLHKLLICIILIVGFITILLAPKANAQTLLQPDSTLVLGVQDTLTYSISGSDNFVIAASYFKLTYDPNVIQVLQANAHQDDWYIVTEHGLGVVEIGMSTETRRAFDGEFFSLTVLPIAEGISRLTVAELSWTDSNNIIVVPERPNRPTNPSPEAVAAMYPGSTYWIDSTYGTDSSLDCTNFDTPCRTDAPFKRDLVPGDAVVFSGGVHRLKLTPVKGGNAVNPITYIAYPGEESIISGADLFTNEWAINPDGTWTATYTTSLPQHPAIAKPQPQWRPEMLIVQDMVYSTVYHPDDIHTESFYITGSSTNPSSVTADFGGNDPNLLKIEMAARDTLFVPPHPIDYIDVVGLTFKHAGNSFAKLGCFEVNGDNWVIVEVLVEECNTTGIKFYGDHHLFSNVASNYNGIVGWNAERSNHVTIEDSYAIGNNTKGFLPNWHAGGAKFTHGTSYLILIRANFHDNNGPGVWFDIPWGVYNEVLDSKFFNNQLAGIFLEHGTIYSLVQNNVSYGTRKFNGTGVGVRMQAASDNRIIGNTIYGNHGSGIFEKFKDKRSPAGHNYFSKNIIGYNAVDTSSDYEIRIDRESNEKIVDHFSSNLIVLQNGEDFTFKIENDWIGDAGLTWLQKQLHIAPFDMTVGRDMEILEDPTSSNGFRSLVPGYGASFEDEPISTGIENE